MAERVDIDLRAVRFEAQPATLLQSDGMTASVFRYSTGIEALSIATPAGKVTFLPFKGQQVWDAVFRGRRLTMRSMFEEPQDTADYLSTYGAFLIHCGVTAMGAPGPQDNHPLHGELPNARFQSAGLIAGTDDHGAYLILAGEHRQARAFGSNYRFRSEVTLRPDATHLEVAVSVENLRPVPLDLMYLAHINFLPVDGGRLVDTVRNDRTDIVVRREHPKGLQISDAQRRLVERMAADPSSHRHLAPGGRIDPEIVLFLDCQADGEGWAHALQRHPDGNADFVSYRPEELPVGVRWISRLGDQEALGLILPSTSGVDGYAAERAKGRVVTVAGGGRYSCRYRCGALDPAAAEALSHRIEATGCDTGNDS
ncbi:MAG TPA: DUF4432 family protein [Dongiaceae bacterium]|jgi:hypothetical protein|nr:DUF4432 family protein [Dongiaceae bacterium]